MDFDVNLPNFKSWCLNPKICTMVGRLKPNRLRPAMLGLWFLTWDTASPSGQSWTSQAGPDDSYGLGSSGWVCLLLLSSKSLPFCLSLLFLLYKTLRNVSANTSYTHTHTHDHCYTHSNTIL